MPGGPRATGSGASRFFSGGLRPPALGRVARPSGRPSRGARVCPTRTSSGGAAPRAQGACRRGRRERAARAVSYFLEREMRPSSCVRDPAGARFWDGAAVLPVVAVPDDASEGPAVASAASAGDCEGFRMRLADPCRMGFLFRPRAEVPTPTCWECSWLCRGIHTLYRGASLYPLRADGGTFSRIELDALSMPD